MKYHYLDIRRNPVKEKCSFRHKLAQQAPYYLSKEGFNEVETPYLIKSTPTKKACYLARFFYIERHESIHSCV